MWNNDTQQWEYCDWLMNGEWFVDDDGFLYILPSNDVVADNFGPDNETKDALNALYRNENTVTDEDLEGLGLQRIWDWQKRFNAIDGYYFA